MNAGAGGVGVALRIEHHRLHLTPPGIEVDVATRESAGAIGSHRGHLHRHEVSIDSDFGVFVATVVVNIAVATVSPIVVGIVAHHIV